MAVLLEKGVELVRIDNLYEFNDISNNFVMVQYFNKNHELFSCIVRVEIDNVNDKLVVSK